MSDAGVGAPGGKGKKKKKKKRGEGPVRIPFISRLVAFRSSPLHGVLEKRKGKKGEKGGGEEKKKERAG